MRLRGHGVLCLVLLNIDKQFSQVVVPIYPYRKRMRVSVAPYPGQHLLLLLSLILTIQGVVHCGFNLHLPHE